VDGSSRFRAKFVDKAVVRDHGATYGSSCPKGPSERSGEARSDPRSAAGLIGNVLHGTDSVDRRSGTWPAAITSRLVCPDIATASQSSFGRFAVRRPDFCHRRGVPPTLGALTVREVGMSTNAKAEQFPDVVEVVVEIPRGSRNKYEYDEAAGVFRLDRVLASAVHYNFDYGFIEGTRAGDGDHTDALLLIDEPTFPGCRVWARPIGGLEMRDDKGFDFKVLCVAVADPHQSHVYRLEQVRPHRLVEIKHFFDTYKLLEDKEVEVLGWREAERAREVLAADRRAFELEHVETSSGAV
jgi:inorganic pyrophosphatase